MTGLENSKVSEDFNQWVNEPIEDQFEKYSPLGVDIMIRLYYFDAGKYQKGKPQILMDSTGRTARAEIDSRLFSVGKVLAVGEGTTGGWAELKPGDLITVQDAMTGSKLNDDWVQYQAMLKEKPSMAEKVSEPPRMIGNIVNWSKYVFAEDKFTDKPRLEDAFTFLVPQGFIRTRYEQA